MKIFVALLGFIFLSSCSEKVDLRTLWLNRQGGQLLKAGKGASAQQKYIEALQYDPLRPELQMNLGLAYEVDQQTEKAMQQYESSLALSTEDEQKFVAYYNQAQLQAKMKKVDEAINLYQKALDLVPDSKEVKTNIELLIQQQQDQQNGQGQNKDQKDKQDKKDQKGQKDQQKDQQDQQKDKQDPKDNQDQKDKQEPDKKEVQQDKPYKPREFKGDLSPADIKKILGEIKQQEQKIRAEFNKKNDFKEQPRDKDW